VEAHREAGVAMMAHSRAVMRLVVATLVALPITAHAQQDSLLTAHGDSVRIRLVDVDLRAAIMSLSPYIDRPVVFSGITGTRVTLQTPGLVPRSDVIRLLRGVLESQGLELIADSAMYRVGQHQVAAPVDATAAAKRAKPDGALQLYAIHLRHARAADVAATVNALYGRGSALGEIGGKPQTLDAQLRENQIPPG